MTVPPGRVRLGLADTSSHAQRLAAVCAAEALDLVPVDGAVVKRLGAPKLPPVIDEVDFIDNVPLGDLLKRPGRDDHLYLVDYASVPGRTKLTCLVWPANVA